MEVLCAKDVSGEMVELDVRGWGFLIEWVGFFDRVGGFSVERFYMHGRGLLIEWVGYLMEWVGFKMTGAKVYMHGQGFGW